MRPRWVTIGTTLGLFAPVAVGPALRRPRILSGVGPARARDRPDVCRRTPRSMPRRLSPPGSTPCWPPIPTSSIGRPISAAAPSASTCRSTHNCPTMRSRRPSWSPRTFAARPAPRGQAREPAHPGFPIGSRQGLSPGPRSLGGLADTVSRQWPRDRRRSSRSPCAWPTSWAPIPGHVRSTSTGSNPARVIRVHVDQDKARLLWHQFGRTRAAS